MYGGLQRQGQWNFRNSSTGGDRHGPKQQRDSSPHILLYFFLSYSTTVSCVDCCESVIRHSPSVLQSQAPGLWLFL